MPQTSVIRLEPRMHDLCFLAWMPVHRSCMPMRTCTRAAHRQVRVVTHVCRCDRHERWSRWLRHGRFRLVVRSSLSVCIPCPLSLSLSTPPPPFFLFTCSSGALTLSRFCWYTEHIQGSPTSPSYYAVTLLLQVSVMLWFAVEWSRRMDG